MSEQQEDVCILHPFERNRYFYGKLMTVRDFETEQNYFRGKDALINRLIHGGGIVCGLEVSEPKEENGTFKINLSAGVAVDCCGRVIVVSENSSVDVVGKLVDGINYIYLKYKECNKEQVPSLADASTCKEKCDYNRIKEIFEVKVEDEAQEKELLEFDPEELKKEEPAQKFYEEHLGDCPQCGDLEDVKVFLAAVDKSDDTITVDDVETRKYRVILPNNPMLYRMLNIHTTDFSNPHETTAEQVGALVSVDGVENPGGNVDLEQDNAVTITSDNENNTITIGENHSERTDNPHQTTAEQVGAPISVDGVKNPGGNIELIPADTITIVPNDSNNSITIGENHSDQTDNPHQTTAEQVGALVSVNEIENPGGNIELVEGDNVTITPNSDDKSITISAEGGLEQDLTRIEIANWRHGRTMNLDEFIGIVSGEGLRVNFVGENLPVKLGETPNEVFLVAAKIPLIHQQFELKTYHYEYFPGKITIEDDGKAASFRLDDSYGDFLREMLSREDTLTILIQLKCDFILDAEGKAVDGHHIGGIGQSGVKTNGEPYGLQGGLFESWLNLIYEGEIITVDEIDPSEAFPGTEVSVTIFGSNFQEEAKVRFSGEGIQVNGVDFISSSQLKVGINISTNAPVGSRDVIVINPDGNQGIGQELFRVNRPIE